MQPNCQCAQQAIRARRGLSCTGPGSMRGRLQQGGPHGCQRLETAGRARIDEGHKHCGAQYLSRAVNCRCITRPNAAPRRLTNSSPRDWLEDVLEPGW